MVKATTEKRFDKRFRTEADISYHNHQFNNVGRMLEISNGGILLETVHSIPLLTRLSLELPLKSPLSINGISRWACKMGSRYRVGIQFIDVTPEQGNCLEDTIYWLSSQLKGTGKTFF